ncbi:MAG TPA: bifunctional ADP-heptose synthase [Thermoanaerobaculia bacterium]|nr:bifunctional ADP-heptose synthase [Thermoanaerobaculia bacterium]
MSLPVSRERLQTLVSSFAGRRVLVAGDFVLDRFVFGHPKRISREAPVLILRFWKEESLPGAAGNTAANVRALGGTPVPIGAVGDDEAGASVSRILGERGIETAGLLEVAGYATPTKTRVLAGGAHSIKQQVVRFDREDRLPDDDAWRRRLHAAVAERAEGADAAVVSDYGYGSVSPDVVAPLRRAIRAGAPLLVDSRHALGSFAGVDAATPNEEELEESAGGPIGESAEALAAAGDRLRARIGCRTLLVTRGSRGMALFDGGPLPTLIPVHGTDQVADVTGAGDTVLAAFSLALASGATPLEAALLANFAGGVVVMKMGTATASAEEVSRAIASDRTLTS